MTLDKLKNSSNVTLTFNTAAENRLKGQEVDYLRQDNMYYIAFFHGFILVSLSVEVPPSILHLYSALLFKRDQNFNSNITNNSTEGN